MPITVLYRETGGLEHGDEKDLEGNSNAGRGYSDSAGQGFNAFELQHPGAGRHVTVGDLIRAFPLGPAYHFDILGRDGIFESAHALDLGSPVPVTSDGVIACRVFPLACPPRYASGGRGKNLDVNVGFDHQGNGRDGHHMPPSSGGNSSGVPAGSVVKDITKNAGKATKGLLGLMGQAVQRTAEYLTQQEIAVGVYRIQIVKELAEGGDECRAPGCCEAVHEFEGAGSGLASVQAPTDLVQPSTKDS